MRSMTRTSVGHSRWLQPQARLLLRKTKASLDVMVVDKIEESSANQAGSKKSALRTAQLTQAARRGPNQSRRFPAII